MKHAKDKARFGVKAKLMSFILPVVAIAFLILSMVAFFCFQGEHPREDGVPDGCGGHGECESDCGLAE